VGAGAGPGVGAGRGVGLGVGVGDGAGTGDGTGACWGETSIAAARLGFTWYPIARPAPMATSNIGTFITLMKHLHDVTLRCAGWTSAVRNQIDDDENWNRNT
jgi:hypothetical protein